MKIWKIIFYTISTIPFLYLFILIIWYLLAANHLGHYPTPDEGYSYLPNFYPIVSIYLCIATFLILPAWVILLIIHLLTSKGKIAVLPIVIGLINFIGAYVITLSQIGAWFLE
ncbi:hypothetical protein ACLI1A_14680 [Flavobacterium sp. RHBU_3]|uniref:hypothetical protein n=1 Tax=Flavobacterium sp. RHBU_3 TaxID=3391184 RepID=UPI0039850FA3